MQSLVPADRPPPNSTNRRTVARTGIGQGGDFNRKIVLDSVTLVG